MAVRRLSVPVFEPEVVAAAVCKQQRADDEKVATTSVRSAVYLGVAISSRYGKARELRHMLDMVEAIDPRFLSVVATIFCDSKAGEFAVDLRWPITPEAAHVIGRQMERAGAHGCIFIRGVSGGDVEVGSNSGF